MEKTFADGGKIAKFVKVFSLESFPLYGIIILGDLADIADIREHMPGFLEVGC